MPRLSKIVTCWPAYVSRRSGTRLGSLVSVNPMRACVPSQSGLADEPPQRHSAICGVGRVCSPRWLSRRGTFVTRYGPFLAVWITAGKPL